MSCAARALVFADVAPRGSRESVRGGRASKAGPSSRRRGKNGGVALASSDGEGSLALVLSPDAKEYYREVRGEGDGDERFLDAAPCDFFELLGVDTDASADDVKQAFRKLQRVAHPDIAGPTAEPLAVLLNSAYATLSDDSVRAAYQKTVELARRAFVGGSQFDGRPVSEWAGPRDEARAIFVDESTCIGCKSCVLHAPNTFEMVEDFNAGRARCVRQWGDDEETMQVAIELCPVDCIYWVKRNQLPILEYAMKGCKREDIAIMARRRSGNMGSPPSGQNPFTSAEKMLRLRREGKAYVDAAATHAGATAAGGYRGHDEELSGAIAAAWLALPRNVREKGWPEWGGGVDECAIQGQGSTA